VVSFRLPTTDQFSVAVDNSFGKAVPSSAPAAAQSAAMIARMSSHDIGCKINLRVRTTAAPLRAGLGVRGSSMVAHRSHQLPDRPATRARTRPDLPPMVRADDPMEAGGLFESGVTRPAQRRHYRSWSIGEVRSSCGSTPASLDPRSGLAAATARMGPTKIPVTLEVGRDCRSRFFDCMGRADCMGRRRGRRAVASDIENVF
jgi:hypothetical protein